MKFTAHSRVEIEIEHQLIRQITAEDQLLWAVRRCAQDVPRKRLASLLYFHATRAARGPLTGDTDFLGNEPPADVEENYG